jgi:hypothetical protein
MLDDLKAAALRHTPPWPELQSAGEQALGPAAVVALAVLALDLMCFGKKAAAAGAAWGMLAAFGLANYYRQSLPWWPDRRSDGTLIAWKWLFLLYVLFLHDGAVLGADARSWRVWVRRVVLAGLAAWLLVPHELRDQSWPVAVFAAMVLLGWAGSEAVTRQSPGGMVALGLSFALLGAGFVMAHAHSASLADALSIPGAALFGIALVAFAARVDVSGAVPGVALLLPAVLLVGKNQTFSEVPWSAFIVGALPPITVGLLAVPPMSRLTRWRWPLFWALCLGPTVAAVTLAMRAETLVEDW